jgi:hypothetical protein
LLPTFRNFATLCGELTRHSEEKNKCVCFVLRSFIRNFAGKTKDYETMMKRILLLTLGILTAGLTALAD